MPAKLLSEKRYRKNCVMVRFTDAELTKMDAAILAQDGKDRVAFLRDAAMARASGLSVELPYDSTPRLKKIAGVVGIWRALGPDFSPVDEGVTAKELPASL